VKYYTLQQSDTLESVLQKLDSDYGLNNLYVISSPISLMGSHKVITVKSLNRSEEIKIDGPGFIVFRIYDRLLQKKEGSKI
jgi:hypothetical protein